jgi:hypothetical protein
VGLFGVQTTAAACSATGVSRTSSCGTNAGVAPCSRTSRAYSPKLGVGTSTESPAETCVASASRIASVPPAVGTTSSGSQPT